MLSVIINRVQKLRLNEHVPPHVPISTLTIINVGGAKRASLYTCSKFAAWVYDLAQRTESKITYNGHVVPKANIKPYRG